MFLLICFEVFCFMILFIILKCLETVAMLEHDIGEKSEAISLGHDHQCLASECVPSFISIEVRVVFIYGMAVI